MRIVRAFAFLVPLAVGGGLAYVVVAAIARQPAHRTAPVSLAKPATVHKPGRHSDGIATTDTRPAPVAVVRASATPSVEAAPHDEAPRMGILRRSFADKPLETLEAARALDRQFPASANAAERSWIEIRSLVNLGRFHEARDLARVLVLRFPESEWAVDAQRHLLVNPLDYPSREELAEHSASTSEDAE